MYVLEMLLFNLFQITGNIKKCREIIILIGKKIEFYPLQFKINILQVVCELLFFRFPSILILNSYCKNSIVEIVSR